MKAINDLAPYLPYGVDGVAKIYNKQRHMDLPHIVRLKGLNTDPNHLPIETDMGFVAADNFTPILRPHSALIERIKIENQAQADVLGLEVGTEFVMAEWVARKVTGLIDGNWGKAYLEKNGGFYFVIIYRTLGAGVRVLISEQYNINHIDYLSTYPIMSQVQIHRALIAMHFDVFNLLTTTDNE